MAIQQQAATASPSGGTLDVNAGMDRFDQIQQLLHQAAYFSLFASNDLELGVQPVMKPSSSSTQIGIRLEGGAYRLDVGIETSAAGLKATNTAYNPMVQFSSNWLMIPWAYYALPYKEPSTEAFDPSRGQRFAMTDSQFHFGSHASFRGFGTGQTFPIGGSGSPRLLIAAAGVIIAGSGAFSGIQGIYAVNGHMTPPATLKLHILVRIEDYQNRFGSGLIPAGSNPIHFPDHEGTYLIYLAEKRRIPTELVIGASGETALGITQNLKEIHLSSTSQGGPLSRFEVGEIIGKHVSNVGFNPVPGGPPGTPDSPIPFRSSGAVYSFTNGHDRAIGSFPGSVGEGRTFVKQLPRYPQQPAFHFCGFGKLGDGDGVFQGVTGMLSFTSAGTIAPHVLSNLYVVRVDDPHGKFRA
jgi:hypothetical protein